MFNVREATLTIRAWLDREPVATLGCEPIVILVLVCTAHPELLGAIGAWMMHLFCCRVFTAVNPDVLSELQVGRTPFFCALGLSGFAPPKQQQNKYLKNKKKYTYTNLLKHGRLLREEKICLNGAAASLLLCDFLFIINIIYRISGE